MKGEYRDDKNHPPNMFSKFHHHHNNHHQPPPPPPPQHFAITGHHHFQHNNNNNTSEEADSRSPPTNTKNHDVTIKNHDVSGGGGNNDGASIEVIRRPRGRPPGSKNKPKPPIVITREPDPSMSPYVLELPGGTDIVDAVSNYCRKRNTGLCILTASGTVANVTLRQPTTTVTPGATVTFHGRFDILSLSATVLPSSSAVATPFANGFTISLAGPQGQIVGGAVAGQLISAGIVYIIATSFNNPLYHRLPSSEEDDDNNNNNNVRNSGGGNTGSAGGSEQSGGCGESGGHHLTAPPSTAADSMSMYSCHMPSDVIWAPTPRQAPPHPPPY